MARPRSAASGVVYFLLVPDTNRVKIGWGLDGERRISEVARMCGGDSILLATVPGTQTDESRMHRRLRRYRTHGEWFIFCPDVWLAIWRAIRFGTSDYDGALAECHLALAAEGARKLGEGLIRLQDLAQGDEAAWEALRFIVDCARSGLNVTAFFDAAAGT